MGSSRRHLFLAGHESGAISKNKKQPVKSKGEKSSIVTFYSPPGILGQAKLFEQPVLIAVIPEFINIVTDHEGQALTGTCLALTLPGIGGKKSVHMGPLIVHLVIFKDKLIPFPLGNGIGPLFLMALAVRMMGHEIMHFEPFPAGKPFNGPFQGIRPAA